MGARVILSAVSPTSFSVAWRMNATARDTGSFGGFLDVGGFWPWDPLGTTIPQIANDNHNQDKGGGGAEKVSI